MVVQTGRLTVEEFDALVELPENADRLLEYIGGEIVEVVSNSYSSIVAGQVLIDIGAYVRREKLGYVTGEAGGYAVSGERYIPDVGFISKAKQPEPPRETYIPNPPDLAVEVLPPTDKPKEMRVKVIHYLAAGTTVWVVDPEARTVEVYTPGPRVKTLGIDDMLDGGDVLPGFTLAVKGIFPD
jgi:Uma2 family endonuclease